MIRSTSTRRRASAWFVGLFAATLVIGSAGLGARAADDDEDEALDTKFFRSMIRGFGLRNGSETGIEYRERSPLVVPPSRALPTPETTPITARTQNWPLDSDVKRKRDERAERRKPRKSIEEESVPEVPGQLDRVGRTGSADQRPAGSTKDATAPSTLSELGAKSMFNLGGLWGQKEEYATFTSEPTRDSLIQPPAGYRSPSAAQPYGVGKEKYVPTAINPTDTAAMRGQ